MSSGYYSLLYNDVLVVNEKKKKPFRFATFFVNINRKGHYRFYSLLPWKDIRPHLVFIIFLGKLRPVAAYTWSWDPMSTTEKTDVDEVLPAWLNSSATFLRPQYTQDNIE